MLGFHFFLKLRMIGDAVWRVVVRSFHNFSSACRCQMLTGFRPLVRCSKIAFQHFPTAVWAETCSQRCCHHPWSNTFRITIALVIFWGGELDTFLTWDSHAVVSGSWNISRSFRLAGCGCWHRHLWEGWKQITSPGETTLIHARKFVDLCRPKWRHPDLTSQYLRLLDSHILFDARLPCFFLKRMMIGDAAWRVVVRSFHNFSRERLRRFLRKKAAVILHLHICWSTSSHLHTCRSRSSHLHTCRSRSSHLHICWPRSSHLHTYHLHLQTCTSADLHLHTFTRADLDLHTCRSRSSHPDTCRSRSSHPHTCRSTSSHLHICRSRLALLLFSLKAGAVPPERHETQPFRTKWTLDVQNLVKLRFWIVPGNLFARNGRWTSKTEKITTLRCPAQPLCSKWTLDVKICGKWRLWVVNRNPFAQNGPWTSKTEEKLWL